MSHSINAFPPRPQSQHLMTRHATGSSDFSISSIGATPDRGATPDDEDDAAAAGGTPDVEGSSSSGTTTGGAGALDDGFGLASKVPSSPRANLFNTSTLHLLNQPFMQHLCKQRHFAFWSSNSSKDRRRWRPTTRCSGKQDQHLPPPHVALSNVKQPSSLIMQCQTA